MASPPVFGWARRATGSRDGGFTLIEVLIAIVILGISLGALFQAFSAGFKGLQVAESGVAASLHGRSKLAEVGSAIPLEEGEAGGTFDDGYDWRVVLTPYDDGGNLTSPGLPLPIEVEVTISREGERPYVLKTLRLAPRQ